MFLIRQAGPFGPILVVLALAVAALIVRRTLQVLSPDATPGPLLETGINAILFWGGIAGLVGFIGQYGGIYNSMTAIAKRESAGPRLFAMGIRESIASTIVGLLILVVAAIAWFLLRARYRRLESA